MMRTIFERVDMGAQGRKLGAHPFMQFVHIAFVVMAARHTGLIGHHKDKIAGLIAEPDGLFGAFQPFEFFRTVQIADIAVQHAVAVKEHRRAPVR